MELPEGWHRLAEGNHSLMSDSILTLRTSQALDLLKEMAEALLEYEDAMVVEKIVALEKFRSWK